jgi:hypothetical protein
MGSDKILLGIDSAITMLTKIRNEVMMSSLETIEVVITQDRGIKPHFMLGNPEPVGFKVQGPTVTSITVTDHYDVGKVLT